LKKTFAGFFLRVFFGILLAWAGAAAACVAGQALLRIPWMQREGLVFSGCFAAYFLIHLFLYRPVLSHVMAHEMTHALAALLMGAKVTSIEASESGGTTVTNKSHVLISLAPYVFPFYTALTLGVYAVAAPRFKIYLLGMVGFTYAFHLALTFWSLSHHQPDLKEGGTAFSLIFIFAGNIIVLMLLIALLWPQALSVPQAFSETLRWAWQLAQPLVHLLKPHAPHPEGRPA
jgi:hypothetical protein